MRTGEADATKLVPTPLGHIPLAHAIMLPAALAYCSPLRQDYCASAKFRGKPLTCHRYAPGPVTTSWGDWCPAKSGKQNPPIRARRASWSRKCGRRQLHKAATIFTALPRGMARSRLISRPRPRRIVGVPAVQFRRARFSWIGSISSYNSLPSSGTRRR